MNSGDSQNAATARPSKVRKVVLEEHQHLRVLIAEIEKLAVSLDLVPLGQSVTKFQKAFLAHLQHEEMVLWPILETIDSWGPVRIERMKKEHGEQRQQVAQLGKWDGKTSPESYVQALKFFIAELNADMESEEQDFLSPEVLRDDVITSNNFGG